MMDITTKITERKSRIVVEVNDLYFIPRYHRRTFGNHVLGIDPAIKYAESLTSHIAYVREAGERIGVEKTQLCEHDVSKWSHDEFPHYAMSFHADKSSVDQSVVSNNFSRAWLHHIHNNPHHWQHWVFPDGFSPKNSDVENGVVQMPERYALEMIADWMGASRAYTGSWDMTDWLKKNFDKVRLHSLARKYVVGKLHESGYTWLV